MSSRNRNSANSDCSRILFESDLVKIGSWSCHPGHSLWREENRSGHWPLLVFPKTPVEISQIDGQTIVTSRNHLVLYNKLQPYRRRLVDPRGDICDYFYFSPSELSSSFRCVGLSPPNDPDNPFPVGFAMSGSAAYFAKNLLFRLVNSGPIEPVFVEEQSLRLLRHLLIDSILRQRRFRPRKSSTLANHREISEAAKQYLIANHLEQLSVAQLAKAVGCSSFHLCRVFKEQIGCSIFRYLTMLRFREMLDRILESNDDLTTLAFRFGFSSHSHMTSQFRREFGCAPSVIRQNEARALWGTISASLDLPGFG